jgi:uncharacterized protein (TIGR00159 family)
MTAFITIRFLDILDILLVAVLLYQVYRLVRGTVAFNLIIGLISVYLFWIVVKALNMELIGTIMGQFIGVGLIALIIVFHPEIRRFLIFIGKNYNVNRILLLDRIFGVHRSKSSDSELIEMIAETSASLAKSKTGALIVIARNFELTEQINSGELLNADISSSLLRTIFFKNTPLHDGAVIIRGNVIAAAGCILPLTQREVDKTMGLRHRAAIGISETTDALAIVVSEERGNISFAVEGDIKRKISKEMLVELLEKHLAE